MSESDALLGSETLRHSADASTLRRSPPAGQVFSDAPAVARRERPRGKTFRKLSAPPQRIVRVQPARSWAVHYEFSPQQIRTDVATGTPELSRPVTSTTSFAALARSMANVTTSDSSWAAASSCS
jgi:hypothetical protein